MMIIRKELSVESFKEYVESICEEHYLHFWPSTKDCIQSVVATYVEERETHEDTEGFVVVLLDDGSYGVFWEYSDSTGHG